MNLQPSHEDIAKKAYEIFELRQNDNTSGNDVLDWLMAEKLLTRHAPGKPPKSTVAKPVER